MNRVWVLAVALSLCGCDCSTSANMDGGEGGGSGGGSSATGGGSAGGGSAGGGGGGGGSSGTGGGTADAGVCQWSLTGELALTGTCGVEPLIGYTTSGDTLAVELDTDADLAIGMFKFGAEKTGVQVPGNIDTASASTFGGVLIRQSDGARWEATKTFGDGSFSLSFTDGGVSEPVAGGTKFVHTHGELDVTLVPHDGGSNPATGNEMFHASW